MKIELEEKDIQELTEKVLENIKPLLSYRCGHDDNYMTVKPLSSYIGLSSQWVYNNIKNLPHINIGNKPLFKKSEIDSYLERYRETLPENKSTALKIFIKRAFKKQLLFLFQN